MHKLLNISIFIVVFITFINGLFFFGLGIYHSVITYIGTALGTIEFPGIALIEVLDRFLIGFVFIIFSVGLSKLFLSDIPFLQKYELPWLKLKDFHQLKVLLISAIMVALFVAWIPFAPLFIGDEELDWSALIFPASMVMMAFAARLMRDLH